MFPFYINIRYVTTPPKGRPVSKVILAKFNVPAPVVLRANNLILTCFFVKSIPKSDIKDFATAIRPSTEAPYVVEEIDAEYSVPHVLNDTLDRS